MCSCCAIHPHEVASKQSNCRKWVTVPIDRGSELWRSAETTAVMVKSLYRFFLLHCCAHHDDSGSRKQQVTMYSAISGHNVLTERKNYLRSQTVFFVWMLHGATGSLSGRSPFCQLQLSEKVAKLLDIMFQVKQQIRYKKGTTPWYSSQPEIFLVVHWLDNHGDFISDYSIELLIFPVQKVLS